MSVRKEVSRLTNDGLVSAVKELVKRGNRTTAELVIHLAEVDRRRLHLKLGFGSLFAYCTERLGLSEGAAYRRIAAARLAMRYQNIARLLAEGRIHLSALAELAPYLKDGANAALIEACCGKSRRQVKLLLAACLPKHDAVSSVRRLPCRETSRKAQQELQQAVQPGPEMVAPTSALERTSIAAPSPRPMTVPSPVVVPTSSATFKIQFCASKRLIGKLDEARALLSHRMPGADLGTIFELALEALCEKTTKERFGSARRFSKKDAGTRGTALVLAGGQCEDGAGTDAGASSPSAAGDATDAGASSPSVESAATHAGASPVLLDGAAAHASETVSAEERYPEPLGSRHIPAAIRREVFERDGGRCTFVGRDGRRCNSSHMLELHHKQPWARERRHRPSNITLYCRQHNQLQAAEDFGEAPRYTPGRMNA